MPRTTYDTDIVNEYIGKYHCFKRLGHGGMSIVYLARDTDGREVAVKVLHPNVMPEERERFRQEAGALAVLTHPGIVKIYDFGSLEFNSFVVTEYVPGVTVRERLDELIDHGEYMLISEVERIFTALCDALRHAHSEGVAHLDIKPSNVILAKDGRVVLTDFGLAKIIGSPIRTATAAMFGTPAYGAPELAKTGQADVRSDIYSLAVMIFEMLTNRLPFVAETPYEMIGKHVHDALPAVSSCRPDLPPGLDAVLAKAAAKEPGDRFQSIDQFAEALTAALNGQPIPHLAAPEQAEQQPAAKTPERARVLVVARNWVAVAVTIVALFAIGISASVLLRPSPPSFRAQTSDQVALLERPDPQSAVLGQLASGTEVDLLAQSGRWFQVRVVESKQVGWLSAEKVSFTTPPDLPVFTNSMTSVFELPDLTSRIIGVLETGTQVALLEQRGAWWRIRAIESGLTGWVLGENLIFILPTPTSTPSNTPPLGASPTPTPPNTATPSPTITPSATRTRTPSRTSSPTSSVTATSSGGLSGSPSAPSPTSTPTPTRPSPTPTRPSPTPTVPSPTPTVPSPTPTVPSPTPTVPSPTPTVPSPTPTVPSPTPTVPSPTPTRPGGRPPSHTPKPTRTPTP